MQNLIRAIIATLCLIVLLPQAQAATKGKPKASQQVQKERLVLMPLRVGDELQSMQGAMESALVDGLQQKYTVLWGEEVEKKAKEVFRKENQKHDCNEERCMQGIAEAFQSELLATANVTKQEGGYVVILTIQNLFDHVVIFTRPLQCKGCDSFAVVDKLKELGVAAAPVAATAAETLQPKINQNDPDAVLWAEAQKGNSVEDYQVYIDTYPKGKYLPFAKVRIKKLNDAAQALAEQQEQQAWDAAQQGGSEESYALYLKGYPNGRFTGLAKVRLDKIKHEAAAKEEAELWKKVQDGEHGRIGIQIQAVTTDLASSMGLSKPEGALVAGVEKGGPADLAGIAKGDVIRKYDGKAVGNSLELPPMIAAAAPGSKALFDLWRNGQNLQVSIAIGKQYGNIKDIQAYLDKYPNGSHASEARSKIETIRNAEPKLLPAKSEDVTSTTKSVSIARMGIVVSESSAGVIVKEVTLPSIRSILMQNDLLLAIGNIEITSLEHLIETIDKIPSGRNIALLVKRGDATSYVAIKLDGK